MSSKKVRIGKRGVWHNWLCTVNVTHMYWVQILLRILRLSPFMSPSWQGVPRKNVGGRLYYFVMTLRVNVLQKTSPRAVPAVHRDCAGKKKEIQRTYPPPFSTFSRKERKLLSATLSSGGSRSTHAKHLSRGVIDHGSRRLRARHFAVSDGQAECLRDHVEHENVDVINKKSLVAWFTT